MRIYILALFILVVFTLIIDWSLWILIKKQFSSIKKPLFRFSYWSIPITYFIFLSYYATNIDSSTIDETNYFDLTLLNGLYFLIYIPKLILTLFLTTIYLSLLIKKRIENSSESKNRTGKKITRSQFLGKMSLMVGFVPFVALLYNMHKGRFKFALHRVDVPIKNLPKGLKGLRIVQLSDIHLGNFNKEYDRLLDAVTIINAQNPDIIVLTGDLVNNFANETVGWNSFFGQLKAKHGKFAVLGNHDYGDYSDWKTPETKQRNFDLIKKAYDDFGYKLLLNSNETLIINGEAISLIGVENWGHPPFPRYGNLKEAMAGAQSQLNILLSHDPDHWEAEVRQHTDIQLSLAGHTHGMQIGFKFKNKEWSPAKWKYKHWGGLYRSGNQFLYVNRGLGVVGIPLRLGMPPEITLLTLGSV